MMAYPQFNGGRDDDVVSFLENLELACISNHIEEQAQMLRVLQICLKGDARAWYEEYVDGLRETPLTLNGEKHALITSLQRLKILTKYGVVCRV